MLPEIYIRVSFKKPPLKAGADWPILAPFLKISFLPLIGKIRSTRSGPAKHEKDSFGNVLTCFLAFHKERNPFFDLLNKSIRRMLSQHPSD